MAIGRSNEKGTLLFDCRNLTAVLRFNALLSDDLIEFSRLIVLAPKNITIDDFDIKSDCIKLVVIPMSQDDLSCLKYGPKNIENFLITKIGKIVGKVTLLTSFPRGVLFSVYSKFTQRSSQRVDFILIDDGYSNIRPENYKAKIGIMSFLKRCYVFFMVGLEGWKNHGFFNLSKVSKVFTVYPEVISQFTSTEVLNVSLVFGAYLRSQKSNYNIASGSTLFLGHHAVESGRLTKREYHSLVSKSVAGIVGNESIFLSMHHSESMENKAFYGLQGMHREYSSLPAELLIAGGMVTRIIAPFNSTLLECDRSGSLGSVSQYVGYIIPGSPMLDDRIKDTQAVCERWGIQLTVVAAE